MSITIINSAWVFKIEYEVGDSGPCRVTCRRLCAVLWGGAVPRRSGLPMWRALLLKSPPPKAYANSTGLAG